LCDYQWSSYRAYAGLAKPEDYIDYGPILAMTPGRAGNRHLKYRGYVEAGIVKNDEEFRALLKKSLPGIGSKKFIQGMRQEYQRSASRIKAEDVAFRKPFRTVMPEAIINAVCRAYKIPANELRMHRVNDWVKPVAAMLLTQAGGLTQRDAAKYLGVKTGAAVCVQLKRLRQSKANEHRSVLNRLRNYLIFKGCPQ
jgi:hypothetical protein